MTSKNKKAGGCGCGGNCGNKKCKKCADAAKNVAANTPAAPATTPATPAVTPADSGKKKLDCGCGGKK